MMRIGTIRGCVIRIHPLLPVLLLLLCFSGAADFSIACISVLCLHEAAHFFCALKMRVQVIQLELTPFGGSMQIPLIDSLSPGKAFLLSAAGPLCNLLFLLLSFLYSWHFSCYNSLLLYFIQCHAAMLCINLLPVLPLDGGRMLLSILSRRFSKAHALRYLLFTGRILAVVFIVLGMLRTFYGDTSFSEAMLGCYLLYAAALEEKSSLSRHLAAFMARRIRLEKHRPLPIFSLCVSASMPVFMLVSHLRPRVYHRIYVVDEDTLRPLGCLSEAALLSALLDHGSRSFGDLLADI